MDDKYQYLEDATNNKATIFYNAKNKLVDAYLDDLAIGYYAGKLIEISESENRSVPKKYGKYTFWIEQKADWDKPKILRTMRKDEPEIVLDLSKSDQSLDYWYPSPNGKLLLYGASIDGNEQTALYVKDIEKDSLVDKPIEFAGFTDQGSVCWLADSRSFIYPRMNGFDKTGPSDKWLLGSRLYMHVLGDNPKTDRLLYQDKSQTVMLIPTLSSDERSVWLAICRDELTHDVVLIDIQTGYKTDIAVGLESSFQVKTHNGYVYLLTNYQASNYRLICCEESAFTDQVDVWDEVLPESDGVLQDFWIKHDGQIIARHSVNVADDLRTYDKYGNQTGIIDIGHHATVGAVSCRTGQEYVYIPYSSFNKPTTIVKLDNNFRPEVVWQRQPLEGDDKISVKQEWAVSKDGTEIPYYLISSNDTKNPAPTVIYGYGGFNIALSPSYLTTLRPWVLGGGNIVMANLRGGSEFGEKWHSSGSLQNKQQTFDDCIAIAEDLIRSGVVEKDKLGVMGGSNGGLMVSAVTMQRPDLFRAGAAMVPLTDMLEFYKHQVAEFWVHEYGDPRIPEQKSWIEKWSPYHYPIEAGQKYPAMYYETALHDARVHPFHAFKMVARLEEEVDEWKGPLLLRTWTDTGHQNSNLSKSELAKRSAEIWAFFAKELGLTCR